jgi:hypothetical protein
MAIQNFDRLFTRKPAATEAHAIGRGGIAIVEQAIGMDRKTIRRGLKEMNTSTTSFPIHRSRVQGGGRKKLTEVSN